MDKEHFYYLLSKKFSGSATVEDERTLNEWLKQEELQELHDWIHKEWFRNSLEVNTSRFDYKKAHELMIEGIKKHEPNFGNIPPAYAIERTAHNYYWRVAAIFLLVVGFSIMAFLLSDSGNVLFDTDIAWTEYQTTGGQHQTIELSDGSKILLNGNSRIRFPKKFSKATREIYLEGEGYLQILKDESRPFLVNIDEYQVQVLGTIFNVNAYVANKNIEVALVEGSVKVGHRDSTDKILLDPSYQVSFDKKTHLARISAFELDKITGWQQRLFVFDNVLLTEALQKLENNYAVTFKYNSDLSECRVNAEFDNESIWTILEALKYATGIDYKATSENQITLTGRGCSD